MDKVGISVTTRLPVGHAQLDAVCHTGTDRRDDVFHAVHVALILLVGGGQARDVATPNVRFPIIGSRIGNSLPAVDTG